MLLRDQHKDVNFGDFLSAYVTCGSVYSVCALLSCPPFTYKYPHYTPKSASTPSSTIVFVCFSLLFLAVFVFFFSFFNNRNDDAPLCQTNLSRSCCCRHRYLRSSACEYLLPLGILGYVTCLLMSLLDSGTILEGPVVFLRKCELDGLLSLGRRRGSQTLQRSGCCPQLCAAEPAADQPVTFRYFFFARHRGKERTSFPSIRKCGWSRCQGLGPPESSSEHLPVQLPQ